MGDCGECGMKGVMVRKVFEEDDDGNTLEKSVCVECQGLWEPGEETHTGRDIGRNLDYLIVTTLPFRRDRVGNHPYSHGAEMDRWTWND